MINTVTSDKWIVTSNKLQQLFNIILFAVLLMDCHLSLVTVVHAAFLEDGWGARPSGMGKAFSAIADDANAPLFNPAGITQLTQHEMTFMYAKLFTGLDLKAGGEDTSLGLNYFSYVAPPIGKLGSLSASWANFQTESLYREDTYALTYARRLGPVSLGGNLKYLRSSFTLDQTTANDPLFQSHDRTQSGVSVDIGALIKPVAHRMPGLKLAVVGKNLTEPDLGRHAEDRVPLEMRYGLAHNDAEILPVTLSMDVVTRDGETTIHGGVERYFFTDRLGLRLGAHRSEVGFGVSFYNKFSEFFTLGLDYGFAWPLEIRGTSGTHRTSLTIYF